MTDPDINPESILRDGQYNLGFICTRLQCELGRGDKTALRWIAPTSLQKVELTFLELEQATNRVANALITLGYREGDIVFTFLPKIPEQFTAVLATLKIKAIAACLFSNFGDEALLERLQEANAVITKQSMLRKLQPILPQLKQLRHLLVVDMPEHLDERTLSLPRLLERAGVDYTVAPTSAQTPSILHFTSGSTGKSKGVQHVHGSILSQAASFREVFDLKQDDIYWCTADLGWVTGTSYGVIAPWSQGITQVHFGGAYDPQAWFTVLQREKVNAWYTAPTALRMLMRESDGFFRQYDLGALRHIFSVGEPLNPEILAWSQRVLKRDIYDTWFQTETGSIMIANRPGLKVKPGSMGKPLAGITAAILSDDGQLQPANSPGNLCLLPGWPSMFITYRQHDDVYREKFRHGHYFTGDVAQRDEEGYYWFLGRSDDVINTTGHLVSPFEVESSLLEISEVAESGVIGAPDKMLFEKVVAFVVLRKNAIWSPDLELKMRLHITNRIASIAAPQEIIVVESLPKNKSGKIMRRLLKARYLGQDAGDTSTLEI
jgi:acetyl-CoA synthetase